MVQVLPASRNNQIKVQQLLGIPERIQKGSEAALQPFIERQKERKFDEAMKNIEGIYGNPELSEQQKLIGTYRELGMAGQPAFAQQLGGGLSRIGMQQQKSFADEITRQKTAQGLQNIQNLYADPNLTDEQKTFGVYNELANNPTLAHNLLGSLQKPQKTREEGIAGEQFSKGYSAVLENDKNKFREVIDDPSTPRDVKNKLTDLWDKQQIRKDVQSRELRSRQTMVQRSYKQAIESEKGRLKDIYTPREERAKINKNIKRLEALQKADLKKLTKDPEAYTSLHLWNYVDPEFLPEEEMEGLGLADEAEDLGEAQESLETQQRVEFLNSKFPPQEFKGKKKQDKSGRIYESDGRAWRLVQK